MMSHIKGSVPLGFFTLAMYSRCTPDVTFDDRETSRTGSPMHRRSFGDASAMHRRRHETSGDIASAARKFNACIENFAMHSRRFVWKNDRRCIGDASPNVRRCIPELSLINFISRSIPEASAMHRRCIAEVSAMLRGCIPEYSLNISGASVFCGRSQYTPA